MKNLHTDLAVERREIYQEQNDKEISGVAVDVEEKDNCTITRVKIIDKEGVRALRKPIGRYITIDVPNLDKTDEDLKDDISKVLAEEIMNMELSKPDSKY